jgi:hypothetical protein
MDYLDDHCKQIGTIPPLSNIVPGQAAASAMA